jgi:hypothetical protein
LGKNEELLNRIVILANDTDKTIKTELAHQFRYLFGEMDRMTIQQYFIKIIDSYLGDNDIIIKTETILAISANLDKFGADYINNELRQVCANYFSLEFSYVIEFFESVKATFEAVLDIVGKGYHKGYVDIIKRYIRKYFMVYEKEVDLINGILPNDYVIHKSDVIINAFKLGGDKNFITDYVIYIVKNILDREGYSYIITYEKFPSVDIIKSTYENLYKFYTSLPKAVINKHINSVFFAVFDDSTVPEGIVRLCVSKFTNIIQSQVILNNEEFFNQISINFDKITKVMNKLDKHLHWRLLRDTIEAMEMYRYFYLV